MARGINKVFLIGNLGQHPEVKTTQTGTQVATLNIATDESYKDKNSGQLISKTEWHRIVLFGKTAEIAGTYLKKGSKVYIEGKLQTRKWQTKEGVDRYTTEIVVDISGQMQMLDSPGGSNSSSFEEDYEPEFLKDSTATETTPGKPKRPELKPFDPPKPDADSFDQSGSDDFDDDIPF